MDRIFSFSRNKFRFSPTVSSLPSLFFPNSDGTFLGLMYASIGYRRTIVTYLYFFLVTRKYTGGGKKSKVYRIFVTETISPVLTKKNRWGNLQEPIVNHRYRTRAWNFLVFFESLRIECRNEGQWSLTIIFTCHALQGFKIGRGSVEDQSRITFCLDLRWFEDVIGVTVFGRYSCFSFFWNRSEF